MGVGRRYINNPQFHSEKKRASRFVGERQRIRELGYDGPMCYEHSFLAKQNVQIYQKDVKGHFGCVNALEISPDERLLVSGGDDRRVLLWTVRDVQVEENPQPIAIMEKMHDSNIFSLALSNKCERIYSAGNDSSLYVHDIATRAVTHHMYAMEAIYNVSTNPIDDNIVLSASEDGRVRMHDLRQKDTTIVVKRSGTMYCAQFNPRKPNIVSVCSKQDGLVIYDSRKWDRPWIHLCRSDGGSSGDSNNSECNVMYGQWNETGDGLFAVRSRLNPIYYNFNSGGSVEFSENGFVNSCTVKSCSFISPNLVMTGSDDWNIYIWQIPDLGKEEKTVGTAYRILRGHRSIVNHVRYSPLNRILFSSGVEKIIKLWSEFDLNGSYYDPIRRQILAERIFVDPRNDDSVEEDLNMLAFFDVLTTNGGDEDMSDSDDNVGDDNSDDDSITRRFRVPPDIDLLRSRGTYFVVSSPEMSEPELLDDDTDQPSTESSINLNATFSENSTHFSEDTDILSSSTSNFIRSADGSATLSQDAELPSSTDLSMDVNTELSSNHATLNGTSTGTENNSILNGHHKQNID